MLFFPFHPMFCFLLQWEELVPGIMKALSTPDTKPLILDTSFIVLESLAEFCTDQVTAVINPHFLQNCSRQLTAPGVPSELRESCLGALVSLLISLPLELAQKLSPQVGQMFGAVRDALFQDGGNGMVDVFVFSSPFLSSC